MFSPVMPLLHQPCSWSSQPPSTPNAPSSMGCMHDLDECLQATSLQVANRTLHSRAMHPLPGIYLYPLLLTGHIRTVQKESKKESCIHMQKRTWIFTNIYKEYITEFESIIKNAFWGHHVSTPFVTLVLRKSLAQSTKQAVKREYHANRYAWPAEAPDDKWLWTRKRTKKNRNGFIFLSFPVDQVLYIVQLSVRVFPR